MRSRPGQAVGLGRLPVEQRRAVAVGEDEVPGRAVAVLADHRQSGDGLGGSAQGREAALADQRPERAGEEVEVLADRRARAAIARRPPGELDQQVSDPARHLGEARRSQAIEHRVSMYRPLGDAEPPAAGEAAVEHGGALDSRPFAGEPVEDRCLALEARLGLRHAGEFDRLPRLGPSRGEGEGDDLVDRAMTAGEEHPRALPRPLAIAAGQACDHVDGRQRAGSGEAAPEALQAAAGERARGPGGERVVDRLGGVAAAARTEADGPAAAPPRRA